jgi:predicted GNAT family acetyltransferase
VSRIKQIKEMIRDGGISLLLFRILHKLCYPVLDFGSTVFFTIDLGVPDNAPPRKPRFVCRQASPADAPQLLHASDPSRTLEQIEERFRSGQICFAATTAEDRIIHTRWCAPTGIHIAELSRNLHLSRNDIYVYDNYTCPEFRGLGAANDLQAFILEALPAMGYSRLHAFVKGDNVQVLRSIKPPHRRTGKLFYLRCFGFTPVIAGQRTEEFPRLAIPEKRQRSGEAFHYYRSQK